MLVFKWINNRHFLCSRKTCLKLYKDKSSQQWLPKCNVIDRACVISTSVWLVDSDLKVRPTVRSGVPPSYPRLYPVLDHLQGTNYNYSDSC